MDWVQHAFFAGPAIALALDIWVTPLLLNPYIWGWPFVWQKKRARENDRAPEQEPSISHSTAEDGVEVEIKDIGTFMEASRKLEKHIGRLDTRPDVEIVSNDLQTVDDGDERKVYRKHIAPSALLEAQALVRNEGSELDEFGFPIPGSYQQRSASITRSPRQRKTKTSKT